MHSSASAAMQCTSRPSQAHGPGWQHPKPQLPRAHCVTSKCTATQGGTAFTCVPCAAVVSFRSHDSPPPAMRAQAIQACQSPTPDGVHMHPGAQQPWNLAPKRAFAGCIRPYSSWGRRLSSQILIRRCVEPGAAVPSWAHVWVPCLLVCWV